jgi:hypothetical protein
VAQGETKDANELRDKLRSPATRRKIRWYEMHLDVDPFPAVK